MKISDVAFQMLQHKKNLIYVGLDENDGTP